MPEEKPFYPVIICCLDEPTGVLESLKMVGIEPDTVAVVKTVKDAWSRMCKDRPQHIFVDITIRHFYRMYKSDKINDLTHDETQIVGFDEEELKLFEDTVGLRILIDGDVIVVVE